MVRQQQSFLVRYRLQSGATERIEVEHIQSGERVLLLSIAAAANWINTRATGTPGELPEFSRPVNPDGAANGRSR
jgi:hypothetical protein